MGLVLKFMLLVCMVSLTIGSSGPGPECSCFHLWRPVCGDDGRTYASHCEARCQGVVVASRGICPEEEEESTDEEGVRSYKVTPLKVLTECLCPFSYVPICGTDGRTYPNECAAHCRGISTEHAGRCQDSSARSRGHQQCVCPPIRAPVCGEDARTYENACVARCRGVAISMREPCPDSVGSEIECACPRILRPVCGQDGNTYNNPCLAHCRGVEVASREPCPETGVQAAVTDDCPCPRKMRPVCGKDGNTYNNPCLAQCSNQEVEHEGRCGADARMRGDSRRRPCICTMDYRPVCGVDGKTYGNGCAAGCAGVRFTKGACGAGDTDI